ncbi:MAG: hypothetical protein M3N46_09345, partial [Actinomycetota bacterium]|nr:hypothetical protein [Actinomycetota bacterium]
MKIVVFAPDSSERSPLAGAVSALSTAMAELSEDADIEFVGVAGRVDDLSADQLEFALFDVDDGSAAEQIAREQRLAAIGDAAAAVTGEVSWQDPAWNTISAIADADAVLILGTGSA